MVEAVGQQNIGIDKWAHSSPRSAEAWRHMGQRRRDPQGGILIKCSRSKDILFEKLGKPM